MLSSSCHYTLASVLRTHTVPPACSYSTAAEEEVTTADESKAHYVQGAIRTLRPERLTEADFIHLPTAQQYVLVWDALAPPATPVEGDNRRPYCRVRPGAEGTTFTPDTKGFLYYYTQPGPAPPTAGEIRFRTMYSPSPLAFNNGKDLTASHGLKWRLQLPIVATNPAYHVLCDILLRDGLVSRETLALARKMGMQRAAIKQTRPVLIHSFKQPFYLDLGSRMHWWHFMGQDAVYQTAPLSNALTWRVGEARTPSPWLGGAVCTFVPDEHPRHAGHRVLNIKLIQDISSEPIRPNPEFPKELRHLVRPFSTGSLLLRRRNPWQLDIDACVPRLRQGFHVLFENAQLPPLRPVNSLRSKAPGEKQERALKQMLDGQRPILLPRSRVGR